ncbi:hypothetical protein TWF696_003771 [Orbilia brochopaga]|uniref:F-box domain-containing protein n=1 Tax=Orbilia brochopaga TaxID=3140254 RepID=A0AAV9VAM2_9PEZI
MGFLKRGKQSLRSRSNMAALPVAAPSTSAPEPAAPSPPVTASRLEHLPVEILQRIFLTSRNPDLALVSPYLLRVLSSSYLRSAFFTTTILDESLSVPEYRAALSSLLTRRFFTLEVLERVEALLWEPHFRARILAEHPSAQPFPLAHDSTSDTWSLSEPCPWTFSVQVPGQDREGTDDDGDPNEPEPVVRRTMYLPSLKYRVAWQLLDLRTMHFPKHRFLLPPYTPKKMEFLSALSRRMPDFWAGVTFEDRGVWCSRAMEIAVRKRCAAMVYLLLCDFHTSLDIRHIRLALLPPDNGDIASLEPEWSRQPNTVSRKDDKIMLKTVMQMRYPHAPEAEAFTEFVETMKDWRECGGRLTEIGWPPYSPDLEDGLRVLWAIDQVGPGGRTSIGAGIRAPAQYLSAAFPSMIGELDVLSDEVLWEAAVEQRGPLLDWLMALGSPPVSLVERICNS